MFHSITPRFRKGGRSLGVRNYQEKDKGAALLATEKGKGAAVEAAQNEGPSHDFPNALAAVDTVDACTAVTHSAYGMSDTSYSGVV